MTIEEACKNLLTRQGMSEHQASEIMKGVKGHRASPSMIPRWNDPADSYTDAALATIWVVVKECALAWIDENCPQAWNRSLFE